MTQNMGDGPKVFLEGMVVLDTDTKTARNLSTKAVVGDYPRSRGKMIYVDDVGATGILVQIGGNQKFVGDSNNEYIGDLVSILTSDTSPPGKDTQKLMLGQVPMNQIDVFDTSSLYNSSTPDGTWYKQNTTGDLPASRLDFCLVLATSADKTSHNM